MTQWSVDYYCLLWSGCTLLLGTFWKDGALVPQTLVRSPKKCLDEWDVGSGCGSRGWIWRCRLHQVKNCLCLALACSRGCCCWALDVKSSQWLFSQVSQWFLAVALNKQQMVLLGQQWLASGCGIRKIGRLHAASSRVSRS